MDKKEAGEVLKDVDAKVEEQQKVQQAYGNMKKVLFDEKTGAATIAEDTYQKIDSVDAGYALQLAVRLKGLLKAIPGLYEAARKFVPKKVREAFKTVIDEDVVSKAYVAKDAYNARTKTIKFKNAVANLLKQYNMAANGI